MTEGGAQRSVKRRRWSSTSRLHGLALALGAAILIGCAALRVSDPYELRFGRELVFDEFQRLAPRPYTPRPVRIVDIDEASLATLGQWPWPRDELARLVDRLHDLGAAGIAFDMVFPEPDRLSPARLALQPDLKAAIGADLAERIGSRLPDNDRALANAIAGRPVVLGFAAVPGSEPTRPPVKAGISFTGDDPRAVLPAFSATTSNRPELDSAAAGIGAITLSLFDRQGVVRRVPLLWSDGSHVYPSLAAELLRVAHQERSILVHATDGPPFAVTAVRVGEYEIPTTAAGEIRVRFSHDTPARAVSAARLLSDAGGQDLKPLIAGHMILVGTSATGLLDSRATPLGEIVPGVSIHAQVLEQILAGDFLRRPDWADAAELAWTLLIGVPIVIVAVLCTPATAFAIGGGLAALTFAGAWLAFHQGGTLFDPLFPSGVGLLLYFALISFRYFVSDRQRRFVRQAFARYVAPSYLDAIEKDPASLRLGGVDREMTILFLDIAGFTTLSEKLSPTEVVEFLNVFLGRLSEDILIEGGTIDKYIGDSIMAFWNAPIPMQDHAARACRAALRIRATLNDLNETDAFRFRQRPEPLPDVAIRIGINTGEALVGNMGSSRRFNYSVVGDTVNVASRVEGRAKSLAVDVVVTETVVDAARGFAVLEAGNIELRGKVKREKLFVLVDDESTAATPTFVDLARRHARLLAAIRDRADWRAPLFECYELADRELPALRAFYGAFAGRLQDFGDATEAEAARPDAA
jgi:adenylate cyclase